MVKMNKKQLKELDKLADLIVAKSLKDYYLKELMKLMGQAVQAFSREDYENELLALWYIHDVEEKIREINKKL